MAEIREIQMFKYGEYIVRATPLHYTALRLTPQYSKCTDVEIVSRQIQYILELDISKNR
jgi:hypothetical protein